MGFADKQREPRRRLNNIGVSAALTAVPTAVAAAQQTDVAIPATADVDTACLSHLGDDHAPLALGSQSATAIDTLVTSNQDAISDDHSNSNTEGMAALSLECTLPAISVSGGLLTAWALFSGQGETGPMITFDPPVGIQSYTFGYRHVAGANLAGPVGDPNTIDDLLPVAAYARTDGSVAVIAYPSWQDLFAAENGALIENVPAGTIQGDIISIYTASGQSDILISVAGTNAPTTPITYGNVTFSNDDTVGEAINDLGGSITFEFGNDLVIDYVPQYRVVDMIDGSNWDMAGGHFPEAADDFGFIDLNNDGVEELWFFDHSAQNFAIYRINSNTQRAEYLADLSTSVNDIAVSALTNVAQGNPVQEVRIADVDADGDWDLIIGVQNQVQVFEFFDL